jgi:hypothetical protein
VKSSGFFQVTTISPIEKFGSQLLPLRGRVPGCRPVEQLTAQIRKLKLYLRAATSFPAAGSLARGVLAGLALVALPPMAWVTNKAAANRDASAFTPNWTSVVPELEVVRKDVSESHCVKRGASERMHPARDTI